MKKLDPIEQSLVRLRLLCMNELENENQEIKPETIMNPLGSDKRRVPNKLNKKNNN